MTTAISFNSIPTPFYVPGQYAEFNPVNANSIPATVQPVLLLIGQMLTGTATAGLPLRVASADQVGQLCGRGSMIHQMAKAAFATAPFVPLYILPLADAVGATKSVRPLVLTGSATAAGEIDLYIGGVRYPVGVAVGATAAAMATSIAAAVQADTDRFVDAAVDNVNLSQVNLTARNAGINAGYIKVALSINHGEAIPAGLTCVPGALTAGTLNPTLATFIPNLGNTWYTKMALAYDDTPNLQAINGELQTRFGPIVSKDCFGWLGIGPDFNTAVAMPALINSQLIGEIACCDVLIPNWVVAAFVAAIDANEPDPGRPRNTVALTGALAVPDNGQRQTIPQLNQLLAAGASTLDIDLDGTVRVQRLVTTYRTNEFGAADISYFASNKLNLLANIRYSWRTRIASKYSQRTFGADGSQGPNICTPGMLLAEAIAIYQDTWLPLGWVQGGTYFTAYKAGVDVEADPTTPGRANLILPPSLIDELDVVAASIQFS